MCWPSGSSLEKRKQTANSALVSGVSVCRGLVNAGQEQEADKRGGHRRCEAIGLEVLVYAALSYYFMRP